MDGVMVGNDHQRLVRQMNKETIKTKGQWRLCKAPLYFCGFSCLLKSQAVSRESPTERVW